MKIFTAEFVDGTVQPPRWCDPNDLPKEMMAGCRELLAHLRRGEEVVGWREPGLPPMHLTCTAPDWIPSNQVPEGTIFLYTDGPAFLALLTVGRGEASPALALTTLVSGTGNAQSINDPSFKAAERTSQAGIRILFWDGKRHSRREAAFQTANGSLQNGKAS